MKKDLQAGTLKELQDALDHLEKQTLPIQTRSALHNAKKQLGQFTQSRQIESDQGRLAALYRVSQSLGVSLNLDEVLTQVMDAVIQLTGAERGFITLVNPENGELDIRAARNIQQETLEKEKLQASRTVIQSVIDSGEGIITTDAQDDPRFAQQNSVIFYALRSILCAPLRARNRVIGVIYVDNRAQSGIFGPDDLDLLSTFAGQAAVAIENAQLYTQTDQALTARVAELETLSHIDQQLNARLDVERVLEIARHWAVEESSAQSGWAALCGDDTETLSLISAPPGETHITKDQQLLATLRENPAPIQISPQDGQPAQYIVPLIHAEKIIGALAVLHPQGFSQSSQEFIQRLAGRAAVAVENARLYQAVEYANEAKSQFISIVTHELRIPLTSIKGYNDLVRQGVVGEINEQQLSFLNIISNNVERMSTLISDLSDISRIERGKIHLDFSQFELRERMAETLTSLSHKLAEKRHKLHTHIPDDLPQVYADPSRVIQILTNLVSNAWKYTPEGGEITINAKAQDERVRVEIHDTGLGISEEDQEKLFTQFFRSESPEVREQIGWGLGLSVTQRLVEIMHGKIGFYSQLGAGSTFWFTLPTQA
ncbi:MAG: GAF domain-containing protein [Chloroflexi bacterium]|jgi:signal transduction histidine kinase|nr:GAF domain-containing protein [Chloroflexota bacterium]